MSEETVSFADLNPTTEPTAPEPSGQPTQTKPAEPVEQTDQVPEQTGQPVQQQKQLRDLSGIPDEDKPYFKAMSNEAFARMKALYEDYSRIRKEYEEISKHAKELPKSWYEHPQAYMLTKEFQQAQQTYGEILSELKHWEQQYEKIVKGEPWDDLEVDEKGNIVTVQKEPSPRASMAVLGYITETRRQLGEVRSKLANFQNEYSNRHKEVLSAIDYADKQFFPNYQDYDGLVKSNEYAATMHKALAELGQDSNPLSKILVKLYTAFMEQKKASVKPVVEKPSIPPSKNLVPVQTEPEENKVSFKDIEPYLQ